MFVNEKAIVEERVDAEELKYNEIKAVVHKKDLCLTMAYLMGAETSRTEKIYTKGVSLVVDWIKRSKDAINIRCLWAKQDGNCIDARIIIKNNTGKRVDYQPTYSLDCIDKNGVHLYVNECMLKNTYTIPDGESHQLDCVFTVKDEKENEKFSYVDFNSMKFSVVAEYN